MAVKVIEHKDYSYSRMDVGFIELVRDLVKKTVIPVKYNVPQSCDISGRWD